MCISFLLSWWWWGFRSIESSSIWILLLTKGNFLLGWERIHDMNFYLFFIHLFDFCFQRTFHRLLMISQETLQISASLTTTSVIWKCREEMQQKKELERGLKTKIRKLHLSEVPAWCHPNRTLVWVQCGHFVYVVRSSRMQMCPGEWLSVVGRESVPPIMRSLLDFQPHSLFQHEDCSSFISWIQMHHNK